MGLGFLPSQPPQPPSPPPQAPPLKAGRSFSGFRRRLRGLGRRRPDHRRLQPTRRLGRWAWQPPAGVPPVAAERDRSPTTVGRSAAIGRLQSDRRQRPPLAAAQGHHAIDLRPWWRLSPRRAQPVPPRSGGWGRGRRLHPHANAAESGAAIVFKPDVGIAVDEGFPLPIQMASWPSPCSQTAMGELQCRGQ